MRMTRRDFMTWTRGAIGGSVALILLLGATAGPARAALREGDGCRPGIVEIRPATGRGGTHRFTVEIAVTPAARARGLMGRRSLAENHGMLFVFPRPGTVAFWMKNTPLPLDMIFISDDGTIRRIHENARPFDLTPIPAGPDVLLVLELAGGTARRAGIAEGDVVRSPFLPADKARWPCPKPPK